MATRVQHSDPTYFAGLDEKVNLWLPWVFILASPIGWALGWQYKSFEGYVLFFLSQTLFLNAIHVMFTPYMIWQYPELRAWFRQKQKDNPWLVTRWIALWVVLFGLHYWALGMGAAGLILFALRSVWAMQHDVFQSIGLNVALNRELAKSHGGDHQSRFQRSERIERRFAFALVLVLGAFNMLYPFQTSKNAWWPTVRIVLAIACGVSILGLLGCSFRFYGGRMNRKLVYWSRMILMPLGNLSPVALCGVRAAHGVEYLMVMRKMNRQSRAAPKGWNWLLLCSLLLPITGLIMFHPKIMILFTGHGVKNYPLFRTLGAAGLATLCHHFYLDRVLFRMRDQTTREAVGPLLREKGGEPCSVVPLSPTGGSRQRVHKIAPGPSVAEL